MVGSNDAGVSPVMSFMISSSRYPTARRAAILAIGNPVALLASALLRDTRGFISITTTSPFVGFTANWMLEPPVSTPMRRMHANTSSRSRWYSTSVRVCAGATVIESPVCTPMASKFSMEQMTTTLSAWSRITSSSYSFHPAIDCSMRISDTGLVASPWAATFRSSSALDAKPVPLPPRMNEGRMMSG